MLAACWRTNARHEGPLRRGAGAMPCVLRTLRSEVSETETPSFESSPTIRRWPQRWFSRARRTISATRSLSSAGRPGRPESKVQRRVTIRRCQRSRVAGRTLTVVDQRARGSERDNEASKADRAPGRGPAHPGVPAPGAHGAAQGSQAPCALASVQAGPAARRSCQTPRTTMRTRTTSSRRTKRRTKLPSGSNRRPPPKAVIPKRAT